MRLLFGLLLLTLSVRVVSQESFFMVAGAGMDDTLIQSKNIASAKVVGFGWQHPLAYDWSHGLFGHASFYINSEWHYLQGTHLGNSHNLNIVAVKPVVRFYQDKQKQNTFFYEMALGVSYFSRLDFEEIELASEFQFATHFSAGWHLGDARQWEVSARYNHYSSGYLARPNPGLDFFSVVVNHRF